MVTEPLRRITAGTLISAVGNGAWYTSWAIFLTQSVHLSAADVGLGMTIAGLAGVLVSTPVGRLSDRMGARATFQALLVVQGLASFGFAAVHGVAAFTVVATVAQAAGSASGGPRSALVLSLCDGPDRLPVLGRLRAISHVGWALGAILGGAAIASGARGAYIALLAVNGASYLVYAGLVRTTPRAPQTASARPEPRRMRVLRDRPYVCLAALMGVLALCWAMLSTGVPLWVTLHTRAPRAVSAAVVLTSCVGIAALQVPANRRIKTPRAAALAGLAAGLALAGSCLLFALNAGRSGPVAVALMAAPVLMTTLIAGWGQPGWLALAAIFLLPALAVIPVTGWALRTRSGAPRGGGQWTTASPGR